MVGIPGQQERMEPVERFGCVLRSGFLMLGLVCWEQVVRIRYHGTIVSSMLLPDSGSCKIIIQNLDNTSV